MPSGNRTLHFTLSLILLIVLSSSLPAFAGRWQGREETKDGVTRVFNPDQPMNNDKTIKPKELWRLGGESEAEEELFGMVNDVLMDGRGNVYVLDVQQSEIRIFSPEGDFIRSIGQEGEGPGDFRNAMGMFLLPDDRIGVIQVMPARISLLRTNGDGLPDMPLPGGHEGGMMRMLQGVQYRGERLLVSVNHGNFSGGDITFVEQLLELDTRGEQMRVIREQSQTFSGGSLSIGGDKEEDFTRHWTLSADGRCFIAPWYHDYKIELVGRDGKLERVIEREYESLKRTKEMLAEMEGGLPEGVQADINPDPMQRDIERVIARDNGELWVLSSRGLADQPEGKIGVFDVFDAQGRYQRRQILDVDFNPKYDRYLIRGDKLFVLKETLGGTREMSSSAGGQTMVMMVRSGNDDDEDEREPEPFELICYDLGD